MAAGLPVVAVQASGVREMIENGVNGILTSCDTSEMAAAICEVLNNPQLYKRLQANALQKAFDLSSHNMALNLESIYTSLLENRDSYKPRRTLDVSSWLSI
jgi:glycosyltransferase involved in cell wall biosynthesis